MHPVSEQVDHGDLQVGQAQSASGTGRVEATVRSRRRTRPGGLGLASAGAQAAFGRRRELSPVGQLRAEQPLQIGHRRRHPAGGDAAVQQPLVDHVRQQVESLPVRGRLGEQAASSRSSGECSAASWRTSPGHGQHRQHGRRSPTPDPHRPAPRRPAPRAPPNSASHRFGFSEHDRVVRGTGFSSSGTVNQPDVPQPHAHPAEVRVGAASLPQPRRIADHLAQGSGAGSRLPASRVPPGAGPHRGSQPFQVVE